MPPPPLGAGTKAMLSKAFLKALAETFADFGEDNLRQVRDEYPETYASVFAQMFPKETTPSDIYSDAQLDRLYDALAARLAKAARNGVETIH
jgi:hypothetical protein